MAKNQKGKKIFKLIDMKNTHFKNGKTNENLVGWTVITRIITVEGVEFTSVVESKKFCLGFTKSIRKGLSRSFEYSKLNFDLDGIELVKVDPSTALRGNSSAEVEIKYNGFSKSFNAEDIDDNDAIAGAIVAGFNWFMSAQLKGFNYTKETKI